MIGEKVENEQSSVEKPQDSYNKLKIANIKN